MLSCGGSTSPRLSTVACKVSRSWFDYIGSQLVSIRSISFRFDSIDFSSVRFDFDAVLWSCLKQHFTSPPAKVLSKFFFRVQLVNCLMTIGGPDVVGAVTPIWRLLNSTTFGFDSIQFDRVRFDSIQSISVRFHSISEGCCPVVARDLQSGYWWWLLLKSSGCFQSLQILHSPDSWLVLQLVKLESPEFDKLDSISKVRFDRCDSIQSGF